MSDDTTAALGFLADNLVWLAHRAEAVEAFSELNHAVGILRTVLEGPPPARYAGPCEVCRRDLYARPDDADVVCSPCNLSWPMQERVDWLLRSADDRLEGAAEIARILTPFGIEVKADVIRQWHARGRLLAHGQDHIGRPTYRIGDVRQLAVESMQRGKLRAV